MRAIRALVLVLALSVCAYAEGNIPCGRDGNMLTDKAGEMENDRTGAIDPITATALQLIQSILPLF